MSSRKNEMMYELNKQTNKQITTLISITTLTGRDRLEARFAKYDDSDSESKNIIYLLCDVSRS
jgi:hypothetical protein